MIIRHDLRPSVIIPEELQNILLFSGGVNQYQESLYRLCLAQDRVSMAAGAWAQWGNTKVADRGDLGIKEAQAMLQRGELPEAIGEYMESKLGEGPQSIIEGMVSVLEYPFAGFILEKWRPPEYFGTPDEWYSFTFRGEPSLGPYPSEGGYDICAGPTPYMPTGEQLRQAIAQDYRRIQSRPASARERLHMRMRAQEAHLEQQKAEENQRIMDVLKDTEQTCKTLSLSAGINRQALADAAGLKGHYGN
jgi:hypothetical protein